MRDITEIEQDLEDSINSIIESTGADQLVVIAKAIIQDCNNENCSTCNNLKTLIKEYETI